jgi:hypothetical protein
MGIPNIQNIRKSHDIVGREKKVKPHIRPVADITPKAAATVKNSNVIIVIMAFLVGRTEGNERNCVTLSTTIVRLGLGGAEPGGWMLALA